MSFETDSTLAEGVLVMTLRGCADSLVESRVAAAVGSAHLQAGNAGAKRVVVDLRGLEFMSSSCFKAFVCWLSEVRELPSEQRYQVEFVSDPARHWQRRSLSALAAFGGDLVVTK